MVLQKLCINADIIFNNKSSLLTHSLSTKMYYHYCFYYYSMETLHSQKGPHYAKHAAVQNPKTLVCNLLRFFNYKINIKASQSY